MTQGKRPTPPAQADRFIEAARQLDADEDEAVFKAKLAQIAQQKPKRDLPEPPVTVLPARRA